jgi:type IV secretory pathway TrbL component
MEQPVSFTERTRDICLYAGITGMLMSVVSIFHYLAAIESFHWLLVLLVIPNICVFITSLFLSRLNRWVIVMMGICLLLFFIYFCVVFLLFRVFVIVFSPSTLILFVYTLALFIYSLIIDLHGKLKENHETAKADAEYWRGKV